ncbi:hypothetical protein [Seleniivibrio woodruffii]|uniref:hypothetical protein n=1 Tax=Seleniivibrio woodruffii TaxID=1078050 RepID=UPI0039E40229
MKFRFAPYYEQADYSKRNIISFIHIGKTAGMTVTAAISACMPESVVSYPFTGWHHWVTDKKSRLIKEVDNIYISGHFSIGAYTLFGTDRTVRNYTFLRNPYSLVMSFDKFFKEQQYARSQDQVEIYAVESYVKALGGGCFDTALKTLSETVTITGITEIMGKSFELIAYNLNANQVSYGRHNYIEKNDNADIPDKYKKYAEKHLAEDIALYRLSCEKLDKMHNDIFNVKRYAIPAVNFSSDNVSSMPHLKMSAKLTEYKNDSEHLESLISYYEQDSSDPVRAQQIGHFYADRANAAEAEKWYRTATANSAIYIIGLLNMLAQHDREQQLKYLSDIINKLSSIKTPEGHFTYLSDFKKQIEKMLPEDFSRSDKLYFADLWETMHENEKADFFTQVILKVSSGKIHIKKGIEELFPFCLSRRFSDDNLYWAGFFLHFLLLSRNRSLYDKFIPTVQSRIEETVDRFLNEKACREKINGENIYNFALTAGFPAPVYKISKYLSETQPEEIHKIRLLSSMLSLGMFREILDFDESTLQEADIIKLARPIRYIASGMLGIDCKMPSDSAELRRQMILQPVQPDFSDKPVNLVVCCGDPAYGKIVKGFRIGKGSNMVSFLPAISAGKNFMCVHNLTGISEELAAEYIDENMDTVIAADLRDIRILSRIYHLIESKVNKKVYILFFSYDGRMESVNAVLNRDILDRLTEIK